MKKMKIYVNIKQIGKRKNKIDKKEYEIKGKIETVKDLLIEFVTINVKEFNEGFTENDVVPYLTDEKIYQMQERFHLEWTTMGKSRIWKRLLKMHCKVMKMGFTGFL